MPFPVAPRTAESSLPIFPSPMTPNIRGKVVFITGPARGIGAAAARGGEGAGHAWFECDVTDQGALERAVAGTAAALGRIDVVIANAGLASHGSVAATPMPAMA